MLLVAALPIALGAFWLHRRGVDIRWAIAAFCAALLLSGVVVHRLVPEDLA